MSIDNNITTGITNAVCESASVIVNEAIKRAGYDRTIQATIVECTDATIGKYKVRYQDTLFYAYATSADITYETKASVYILVPGNDFRQVKTIIGTVQKLGINYVPIVSEKDSYELNGANCVGYSDKIIQLTSYTNMEYTIFEKNGDNVLGIDENALRLYLYDSDAMLCTMRVENSIPAAQRYQGNYGVKFNLAFKNTNNDNENNNDNNYIIRSYVFDNSQMVGNPYKFITPSMQTKAFKIDGINFSHIDSIIAFAEGFPEVSNKPDKEDSKYRNILLSNIEITAGIKLSEDALTGYKLTFLPIKGTYFTAADAADAQLPIQAQVRIKGKVAASDSSQIKYYWFRENSRVDASSKYYTTYGGQGWECLNKYNVINESTVEYVPSTYEYLATKNKFPAKETILKCCAVYNDDIVITNTISIKNLDSDIGVSITSSNGNQFYYDSGETVLTCTVDRKEDFSYNYYWGVSDNNNYFTSIDAASNSITVAAKDITDFSTYVCTVYQVDAEGELFVGSAQMILRNSLEAPKEPMVIINGGTKVFKYNIAGVSPTAKSQEHPEILAPLTFTIFDEERKEITAQCKSISWKIPMKNTMISLPNSVLDECIKVGENGDEDAYYLYSGKSLIYDVRDRYNVDYNNNTIILAIECRDLKLVTQTHFSFTKEGEMGTNGTDYFCKIVMNSNPTSTIPSRPAIINGVLNYTPLEEGKWFKAELWNGNVRIDEKTEEKKDGFVATWSILKNKYTSSISDVSHISYDEEKFHINENVTGTAADIVQVKVTYDKKDYYAVMPIVWIKTKNGTTLDWKQRTGFNSVMYQTDGTKPIYNDAYPFELTSIDEAEYKWQVNGSIYRNQKWIPQELLTITGKSNKVTVKPASIYDGYCVNTSISCTVKKNNEQIAYINIPIHMYLNRFGQEALNGWNGNSIQLDTNGGHIYSPQVGAGVKDANNRFTGVLLGKVQEYDNSTELVGLLGYSQGVRSIFLDSKTGKAEFGAVGEGKIILDPKNKTAKIYSGNYSTSNKKGMLIDFTTPEIKFGSGNFNVNENGHLTAKGGGSIAGWKIGDSALTKGQVGISSDNTNNTNIAFWAGSTNASAGKFKVDFAGKVTANDIHASGGTIGNWQVKNGRLQTDDESIYLSTGGFKFKNNFTVSSDGKLTAKSADITGTITATSGEFTGKIIAEDGTIGGWTIGKDTLTGGNVTLNKNGKISGKDWSITNAGLATFSNINLTGGKMDWGDNFQVNSSGTLTASGAVIKGNSSISGAVTASKFKFNDGDGHFISMGYVTNHAIASGFNVGSGGISFRPGSTASSLGSSWGGIGDATTRSTKYIHLRTYNNSDLQTGFCVSSNANIIYENSSGAARVPRIEFSPDGEITLRSSGALYLRTKEDSGNYGLRIYSNKVGNYYTGITGYVKYLYDISTSNYKTYRYLLFVNGLFVGLSSSAPSDFNQVTP